MPGLPPFAKYQNGIDQCLFQLVFTMVVVAKMTVTDAGGEESGRGAHLVERVVMGWWRGVEERTLWRDQNFDLKNLFGGIRYEENGNVLVGDSCVHCPGWWSSSIGIKSNNDCMLPKSWKWYLFSDAEWFYCCSIFDTRSGLMKIFDTSFGSIKDLGVMFVWGQGWANTLHECLAPNFHHQHTKRRQVGVTPSFCHKMCRQRLHVELTFTWTYIDSNSLLEAWHLR